MSNNRFQFSAEGKRVFLRHEEKGPTKPGSNSLIFFLFPVRIYQFKKSNALLKLKGWPYLNHNVSPKMLCEDIKPYRLSCFHNLLGYTDSCTETGWASWPIKFGEKGFYKNSIYLTVIKGFVSLYATELSYTMSGHIDFNCLVMM